MRTQRKETYRNRAVLATLLFALLSPVVSHAHEDPGFPWNDGPEEKTPAIPFDEILAGHERPPNVPRDLFPGEALVLPVLPDGDDGDEEDDIVELLESANLSPAESTAIKKALGSITR